MKTRSERAVVAIGLRRRGLLIREVAAEMGISRTYAADLVSDPMGVRLRARLATYRGTCEECGGPTTGCNGREKAPTTCRSCLSLLADQVRVHGSASMYRYEKCRCEACRRAQSARCAESKARAQSKPIPAHVHGTTSGYRYWRCRCPACRSKNSAEAAAYQARRKARVA